MMQLQRVAPEGLVAERLESKDAATFIEHHASVLDCAATAETLQATLENMRAVEEVRRTLRDIRDVNKLKSN